MKIEFDFSEENWTRICAAIGTYMQIMDEGSKVFRAATSDEVKKFMLDPVISLVREKDRETAVRAIRLPEPIREQTSTTATR